MDGTRFYGGFTGALDEAARMAGLTGRPVEVFQVFARSFELVYLTDPVQAVTPRAELVAYVHPEDMA